MPDTAIVPDLRAAPSCDPAESNAGDPREPLAVTRCLADFLARTSFGDVPPHVIADTKRAVLDWFGSAMAGALEPPARMARAVVAGFGTAD